jgi:uncharacterized protein (TIGR02391 family)
MSTIVSPQSITTIKNNLIQLSNELKKTEPFYSKQLFSLKDSLFIGYGNINPFVFGQIFEILQYLNFSRANSSDNIWGLIHPLIISVSKNQFIDGYYAEAAENAFKEINSRVKKIYHILDSSSTIPDGKDVMNKVFTPNNPMLELCDRSTDSGKNIQLGFKEMFSGSMSALRNPKAHENIQLTSDDAMRQIIFASMLMYKIDDGVAYSHVNEN